MDIHGRGGGGWRDRWARDEGQVLSEYLTVLGVMMATVVVCMAAFITPVVAAYIRLFKRLVLHFTSP
jgi:hypothetical protein